MTLCECGCGQEVKKENRFIHGHNRRGKRHTEESKQKMRKMDGKVRKFIIDNTNKHLCECGCGNYIEIKPHHLYYGIPKYINGHHTKVNHPMKGKHHTEESKQKNREAHKKENLSEETLQKMRDSHIGNKHTQETIEKIRIASINRHHTEESKQKIREAHLNMFPTEESKQKNREVHLGRHHSEKSKQKIRGASLKWRENQRWNFQVNNLINGDPIVDWINRPSHHYGISEEDYNIWRHLIYERDKYTCQICGKNHCKIHAHHIRKKSLYPELILKIDNGITMCKTCHELTYGKEELFAEELQMMVDGEI